MSQYTTTIPRKSQGKQMQTVKKKKKDHFQHTNLEKSRYKTRRNKDNSPMAESAVRLNRVSGLQLQRILGICMEKNIICQTYRVSLEV